MSGERKTPWTPGPWKAHPYTGCCYYIHSLGEPYAERIATIAYSDGVHSRHEADARLIAEAPAMAELIAALLTEWDKLTRYGSPMAKAANERVEFARALLARIGAPR